MSYEANHSHENSSPIERGEINANIPVHQDAQKVFSDTRDATTVALRSPEAVRKEKQDPATYIQLLDDLQAQLIICSPNHEESIRSDIEGQKKDVTGFKGAIVPHVQEIFLKKMKKLESRYDTVDNGSKKKKKKHFVEI